MTELIPFYTFHSYITPEQARDMGDVRSLKELRVRAKINRECENEDGNPVWRYGVDEMCFTCCTGETDASDDFELRLEK